MWRWYILLTLIQQQSFHMFSVQWLVVLSYLKPLIYLCKNPYSSLQDYSNNVAFWKIHIFPEFRTERNLHSFKLCIVSNYQQTKFNIQNSKQFQMSPWYWLDFFFFFAILAASFSAFDVFLSFSFKHVEHFFLCWNIFGSHWNFIPHGTDHVNAILS